VVEGRSGTLLELRGDEALVVFASARQAIGAAVDLQTRFVDETVTDATLPLAVGIGLDAGEPVRVEGGYRGGVLNRAARLCGVAAPGEVLASREVVHLAGSMPGVDFVDKGELSLKGMTKAVDVIEVASATRPAAPRIARLGPFQPRPTSSGGRLWFQLLGHLKVFTQSTETTDLESNRSLIQLGPPKQRAVLAILVLHSGEIVPAERLIELVWGDRPPKTAAHSVQIYVSELRKTIDAAAGRPVILTRPPGYLLDAEPDSIDATRFERLIEEGSRALEADDRVAAAIVLRTALSLWHGPPLSDFTYEEFAQPYIRRLQGLRLAAIEWLAEAVLADGHPQEALTVLEPAIRDDPLRERLWEFHMLALYRSGRQPQALRAYQDFRRLLADELGLDPSPSLQRLHERVLLHDPSLGPAIGEPTSTSAPARNPYKGLRPYGENDAEDFFGREALVEELLDRLARGASVVAAVGPSGSGKSSVVAAGLIPALRAGKLPGSQGWVIARMRPGLHPFEELAAALVQASPSPEEGLDGHPDEEGGAILETARRVLPPDGRLILVIDQFEELFTVAEEPSRDRFLSALATAVDTSGHIQVVVCLRGDFYDRPMVHGEFAKVFAPGVVNVLPMTPVELEEAVASPPRSVGVEVEAALLAELVADTAHQPGALPLLQYALTDLFDKREGSSLTLEAYWALGGLRGPLSRRSEEVFQHLDAQRQGVALQAFPRLVRMQESGRPLRRRVPVSELTSLDLDPVALSDVLRDFGNQRLLTFDWDVPTGDATVEVAHEALLWEWDRLAEWLERHRVDLRRQEALAEAAREWQAVGRNPDFLLTGSRLADYEEWSRETPLRLTAKERGFLEAGLERRRVEEADASVRFDRQRRLERRARTRLVALGLSMALLTAVATYGFLAWRAGRPPEVVMLFEGPGDAGANDMLVRGFNRTVSRFGIRAEKLTENPQRLEEELRGVSEEGVDLIIGLSLCLNERVAKDYPDVRYVMLDCWGDLPNVTYVPFLSHEGSFLVGAAAALKSQTGVIGFVGGIDISLIWPFQAGFEAGGRAVRPDIQVLADYLTEPPDFSGFESRTLAAEGAENLYRKGADVVYHAAGEAGVGVFNAAGSLSHQLGRHLWAIGVDTDQYRSITSLPDVDAAALQPHILTSMVKRFDRAVSLVLADYSRGTLSPGVRELGLANGGIEISYSGGFIEDIRPRIEALRARIIAGKIDVPWIPRDKKDEAAELGTFMTLGSFRPDHLD
jgi:basic membrane lipoprotein Med (substrate-binding protein (PBP1-ABC) superfamily)/DNA-binding SARP family transcriptional activator